MAKYSPLPVQYRNAIRRSTKYQATNFWRKKIKLNQIDCLGGQKQSDW